MKLWVLKDLGNYMLLSKEPDEETCLMAWTDYVYPDTMLTYASIGEADSKDPFGITLPPGQFCQIKAKQVSDVYYYD